MIGQIFGSLGGLAKSYFSLSFERFKMSKTIPVKEVYQTDRCQMCWAALDMMIVCTAATIYDPARMSEADSILMAQHLALSGLVGAYFALGNKGGK